MKYLIVNIKDGAKSIIPTNMEGGVLWNRSSKTLNIILEKIPNKKLDFY